MNDANVERVRTRLHERSQVGIKKYGVTTDGANIQLAGWLRHLQDELLDGAVYVEAALSRGADDDGYLNGLHDALGFAEGLADVTEIADVLRRQIDATIQNRKDWAAEQQQEQPTFTASMYGSAEAAKHAEDAHYEQRAREFLDAEDAVRDRLVVGRDAAQRAIAAALRSIEHSATPEDSSVVQQPIEPVSAPYTLPCPCGLSTCVEPWEPGCGLGNSEEHAVPVAMVPLEPTVEMQCAGFESDAWDALGDAVMEKGGWPYSCRESAECVTAIYKAMLAAAPGSDAFKRSGERPATPAGLLDRIRAAERRIANGHAPRRIPADPEDVDLVLAEVRAFLEGQPPPFWVPREVESAACATCNDRGEIGGHTGQTPESVAWPKVEKIGRDVQSLRCLVLYLERNPSDAEVRALHDAIRTPPAPRSDDAPRESAASEAAQEPVIAECIGVMKDDSEYGNVVHWLTEGGIDAVEPGDYLYIINAPAPPDGALTLYTHPAPLRPVTDEMVRQVVDAYVFGGEDSFGCVRTVLESFLSQLAGEGRVNNYQSPTNIELIGSKVEHKDYAEKNDG